jgi:hypothetical protein
MNIAVQGGYATYIVNKKLYNWFKMERTVDKTLIVPTDSIFIVRTATGKYAKVWFKDYYNNEGASGYIKFQYKYQPSGSMNFK